MEPLEAQLRAQLQSALDAQDWARAEVTLGHLWRVRPTPAIASMTVSKFRQLRGHVPFSPLRVLILRSYTVEPTIPLLKAMAFTHRLDLDVQVGGFNTYAQELLDPSSIVYSQRWDVVILAAATRDVAPDLWNAEAAGCFTSRADQVASQFAKYLETFRQRSEATLMVHTLEAPAAPNGGLLDASDEDGQMQAIADINRQIRKAAAQQRDTFLLDYDGLVARHGRARWVDERMRLTARLPMSQEALSLLAQEWLKALCPVAGRTGKILVTDLDNTLWGGVVGEDGVSGIKLGDSYPGAAFVAVQRTLADLQRQGILLAIASKNNRADAMSAIDEHPDMLLRAKDFSAERINWNEKSQSLREIAKELNVGIDSLVFLDDNPIEREKVRAAIPEVTVLELPEDPFQFARVLRDCPELQRLRISAEDLERTKMYSEQRDRQVAQESSASVEDFFRSLDQQVEVEAAHGENIARIAQLTKKTNQFNATTRRYNEQQITAMAADPECGVFSIRVQDRFGDNGLVGVMVARMSQKVCEIDSFLLSCRVMSRTVETAMLSFLCEWARSQGASDLEGVVIPTAKNSPIREIFEKHGFNKHIHEQAEVGEEEFRWRLDLNHAHVDCPEWIRLQRSRQLVSNAYAAQ